jgi:hypothetical protein
MSIAKQLIGFFQVILLFRTVYQIPFPSMYIDVLNYFVFINLDFIELMRIECTVEMDWHTR